MSRGWHEPHSLEEYWRLWRGYRKLPGSALASAEEGDSFNWENSGESKCLGEGQVSDRSNIELRVLTNGVWCWVYLQWNRLSRDKAENLEREDWSGEWIKKENVNYITGVGELERDDRKSGWRQHELGWLQVCQENKKSKSLGRGYVSLSVIKWSAVAENCISFSGGGESLGTVRSRACMVQVNHLSLLLFVMAYGLWCF